MTRFTLHWQEGGEHIHVRMFAAPIPGNAIGSAKVGNLTFRREEWEAFLQCLQNRAPHSVLILPEDGEMR